MTWRSICHINQKYWRWIRSHKEHSTHTADLRIWHEVTISKSCEFIQCILNILLRVMTDNFWKICVYFCMKKGDNRKHFLFYIKLDLHTLIHLRNAIIKYDSRADLMLSNLCKNFQHPSIIFKLIEKKVEYMYENKKLDQRIILRKRGQNWIINVLSKL